MKFAPATMIAVTLAVAISLRAAADESSALSAPPAVHDEARVTFVIAHTRADFRAGVMDWIYARNAAIGWVSDFALPGSELPLHLDVDAGDKQVLLEWKFRFR